METRTDVLMQLPFRIGLELEVLQQLDEGLRILLPLLLIVFGHVADDVSELLLLGRAAALGVGHKL